MPMAAKSQVAKLRLITHQNRQAMVDLFVLPGYNMPAAKDRPLSNGKASSRPKAAGRFDFKFLLNSIEVIKSENEQSAARFFSGNEKAIN
jgi:hypothetical protein